MIVKVGVIPDGHDHCACDAQKLVAEKICRQCAERCVAEMRANWPKNDHKPVGLRA